MRVKLGTVGHFGLAVPDPHESAAWWKKNFDLREIFRFERGVGLSNANITIVLMKGRAQPKALQHMSFHVADMKTLRRALGALRKNGVELEDPDDEIGPEAPGSPNLSLWFRDPDGYRWELSVPGGARER